MLEWVTRPTLTELTAEFCRRIEETGRAAPGVCAVALTGGSSAAVFYDAWAARGVQPQFEFYWSDERLVPPDHPDSNFKLAADHLLRPTRTPETRTHPAPTYLAPAACAAAYATEIQRHVAPGPGGVPRFSLVILGLGADGHTGSLLPGRNPHEDNDLLVRAVEGSPAHPHGRVTFTPRLINAAAQVWFVVTGAQKAWAVEQLAERAAAAEQVPAMAVDPQATQITIFADQGSTGGRTPPNVDWRGPQRGYAARPACARAGPGPQWPQPGAAPGRGRATSLPGGGLAETLAPSGVLRTSRACFARRQRARPPRKARA